MVYSDFTKGFAIRERLSKWLKVVQAPKPPILGALSLLSLTWLFFFFFFKYLVGGSLKRFRNCYPHGFGGFEIDG